MGIVDDVVVDIDRPVDQFDELFNDLDGHMDTGAEAAWVGEYDPHDSIRLRKSGDPQYTPATGETLTQTASQAPSTVRSDLRRRAARSGENFSVLSPLLPRDLVDDFASVYAFCRRADDIADNTEPTTEGREAALQNLKAFRVALQSHLDPAVDPIEHPDGAMLAELARTVSRRQVRHGHLYRLLDAFERDQRQTRYETWDELLSYCECSANPVGRIVLEMGGLDTTEPTVADIVAWSDMVCTALQLTNHWQDVRRDLLERDRVYLPEQETGLTDASLREMIADPKNPELRVRFIRSLRPLVQRTESMYREARPLAKALADTNARRIAPTVRLLASGGEATLRKIERTGCTTLFKRPAIGRLTKAVLVGRAAVETRRRR